jgi:hypothetical protein
VARDGWKARLLGRQDPEGTWAGGLRSAMALAAAYFMDSLIYRVRTSRAPRSLIPASYEGPQQTGMLFMRMQQVQPSFIMQAMHSQQA